MQLVDALRGRRSVVRLTRPAPSDEEFVGMVEDCATCPDHGRLRPWRLVLVRGRARETLGKAFAAGVPISETQARARAAAKPLRAPLLVSIIFTPRPNPKVPEWEQLAAVTAVVHSLLLLLHAQGWGALWRTGGLDSSSHVAKLLGLDAGERCLGWLYVGTPDVTTLPGRPGYDVRQKLFSLSHDGSIVPMFCATPAGEFECTRLDTDYGIGATTPGSSPALDRRPVDRSQ